MIDIWNGKLKGFTNPASYIKDKISNSNLKQDLEAGRGCPCAFRDIYLSNIFSYQKPYHLVEPFSKPDFFQSASARCKVVKELLYPRTVSRKCFFV